MAHTGLDMWPHLLLLSSPLSQPANSERRENVEELFDIVICTLGATLSQGCSDRISASSHLSCP